MMDLSFRWPHRRFTTPIGEVSFRLHTFENVYGIDPEHVDTETEPDGRLFIHARKLSWAGGQQTAEGAIQVAITPTPRAFGSP